MRMWLPTIMFILLLSASVRAQMQINEVHATPPGGEPEWVECWNVGSRSVDIGRWWICDARTCVRLPPSLTVAKGGFVILTRDAEALREARSVPSDALIVDCALPSLNNTTDAVVLRDADSVAIDSVSYRIVVKGRSIERDADGGWAPSLSRDSASCGSLNSRVVLDHDVRVAEVRAGSGVPSVDVVVENRGRVTVRDLQVVMHVGERLARTTTPVLEPTTSWTWNVAIDDGDRQILDCVAIALVDDDRSANDTASAVLLRPPAPGTVTITEVMFEPSTVQCDYVEVLNGTTDTVDLEGWMLVDADADTVRIGPGCTLPPGALGVAAVDTIVRAMMDAEDRSRTALVRRSFNIDTDGERIELRNPSGFIVDAATIDPSAHVGELAATKGVALEKLAPTLLGDIVTSWTSSGDLRSGSPGRTNGVSLPLPMAAQGTVVADKGRPRVVRFAHPFRHAVIYVRVFTSDGHLVRTLVENVLAGQSGAVVWDERDDGGRMVDAGPYVIILDAYDAGSDRVVHAAGVVVAGG
jgi:hypothetical protein